MDESEALGGENWVDENGDSLELTPKMLQERYHSEEHIEKYGGKSLFERLFTPKSRALILDALLGDRGDPMTVRMIVDRHESLSTSGFHRHKEALLDHGVMIEADKRGNAQQYALNINHPIVQLLAMFENIAMGGRTPPLLDEQFVFRGDKDEFTETVAEDAVSAPDKE